MSDATDVTERIRQLMSKKGIGFWSNFSIVPSELTDFRVPFWINSERDRHTTHRQTDEQWKIWALYTIGPKGAINMGLLMVLLLGSPKRFTVRFGKPHSYRTVRIKPPLSSKSEPLRFRGFIFWNILENSRSQGFNVLKNFRTLFLTIPPSKTLKTLIFFVRFARAFIIYNFFSRASRGVFIIYRIPKKVKGGFKEGGG